MALTTGKNITMNLMTERNCSGILDGKDAIGRSGWMTFFAISGYRESRIAVMTCSARLSLFHLRHRIADASDSPDKNSAVALITFIHLEMVAMAELCIKGLKTNVLDVFMTFLTISFNGKGRFSVVAGSA